MIRSAPRWGQAGVMPVHALGAGWGPSFLAALKVVAHSEGGDADHSSDPGGKTRWGITQGTFHAWLRREGEPLRGVETLDVETAAAIYRDRYWIKGFCAQLDPAAAIAHFDACVQHGLGGKGPGGAVGAMHLLQRALGVTDDGIVGPRTRDALQPERRGLVEHLLHERVMHYWRILDNRPTLRVFSAGWRRRVEHMREEAMKHRPLVVAIPPLQASSPMVRLRTVDTRPIPVPHDARRRAA